MSDKNLMNLIVSKGVSSLSGVFSSFMLNLWLFDKTSSYVIFILNTTATSLVPLFLAIPAGIVSDKHKKEYILAISDLSVIISLIVLILITAFDYFNVVLYITIIVVIAIANEFRYTAMTALIPELANKEKLMKYNGVQQIFRGASVVIGPVLGAISYKVISIQYALFFSIMAQIYSLWVLKKLIGIPREKREGFKKSFNNGYMNILRWIWHEGSLRIYLFSFTLISAIMAAYTAIITPYILDVFDKKTLVFFTVIQGFGLLFSGFLAVRFKKLKEDMVYFLSMILIGISIFFIGFTKGFIVYLFSLFLGISIGLIASSNQTIWQKNTPIEMQGRVVSIRTFSLYALSPVFVYLTLPFTEYFSEKLSNYFHVQSLLSITISFLGLLVLVVYFLTLLFFKFGAKKYEL